MKLFTRFSTAGALWIALLFGVGVVAAPALLTGCGGDKTPDKKKKGGKKKGGKKKGGKKKGDPKEEGSKLSPKELEISDLTMGLKEEANFILVGDGTFKDIWNLKKKLDEGMKKVKELGGDKTGEFKKIVGLIKEKVLSGPLQNKVIGWANKNPEDYSGAIKKFKEILAYLEDSDGPEIKKVRARLNIEIKTVEDLKQWVQRKPSGQMDLLAKGKTGWVVSGKDKDKLQMTFSGGEMSLITGEGKSYTVVTAKHAFWRDYKAQIDFTLEAGEFLIIHRHIPGKSAAPFQSNIGKDYIGGKKELTFEMIGEAIKVLSPEGELDHLTGDVPGGGITFKLTPGTRVVIHQCIVSPE